jgi:nucleotide-binding universal stress UspA family protein
MKQILCVVDLTESSGKVLEVAIRIAKAYGSSLLVLYPYRLITNGYSGDDIATLKLRLENVAREKFNDIIGKSELKNLPCEFQPEIGFLADRISAHTRRKNIDMVIIAQLQSDMENDIRSFNLHKLISNSQIPFVIVPAEVNAEASV